MADTDATLIIGVELDDGTIRKVSVNANEIAEKIGKSMSEKVSSGVDKSFTGLAVQFQAVAKVVSTAFNAVAGAVSSAIDEAVQAEQAVALFNATLANSGKFSQAASADFLAFASSLQAVGTVSDDAIVSAATSLVSIGKLSGDSLKTATQAAVDLSAGLGIDLNTAFDLVAKSAAGNTAALGRYGIKVDENIPKSERFANVLGQINDKFGGLDVTRANTFGGALTQLSNSFNDLLENVGGLITNSPTLVAVFKFISQGIQGIAGNVAEFGKGKDVLAPIITTFIEIAIVITQNVLPVIELLGNAADTIFKAILTGATAIGTAFSGIALAATTALNAIGVASDETLAKVQSNFDSNKTAFVDLANATAESASQISTNFTITEKVDTFLGDMQRAVDTASPLTQQLANSAAVAVNSVSAKLTEFRNTVATQFVNGVGNAMSQGIQRIVTNLATGKNAFDGLLKVILGIFGDMLITIGTTTLMAGTAMEAMRQSIVDLAGGPALFAGVALIAAGSLLKALSGGGGSAGVQTTTPVAPGGVGSQPGAPGITDQPDLDRNRSTKVDINIQGNVLDRKETGLEIASILQEFVDKQDGVLVRG